MILCEVAAGFVFSCCKADVLAKSAPSRLSKLAYFVALGVFGATGSSTSLAGSLSILDLLCLIDVTGAYVLSLSILSSSYLGVTSVSMILVSAATCFVFIAMLLWAVSNSFIF